MHRRLLVGLLVAFAFSTPNAIAQSLDKSANEKIDEAINEHYLATDFKKAEGVLLGTIKACGSQCTAPTLARAWMYIGIVRGSGRKDQTSAREAFSKALALDRNVKLDEGLASDPTMASFYAAASAGGGQAAAAEPGKPAAEPGKPAAGPGKPAASHLAPMTCTPNVPEVEVRRPIPVACAAPKGASAVDLYYRMQGAKNLQTVPMQPSGGQYSTVIPCLATSSAGQLELYALARGPGGIGVAQWGGPDQPHIIRLVEQTTAAPPSLPGQPPPERCKSGGECPPGFPGCMPEGSGWGEACSKTQRCKRGLTCKNSLCEPAAECETGSDCASGICSGGYCEDEQAAEEEGATGASRKNWIGLHIAGDIAMIGGDNVCSAQGWNDNFRCYDTVNNQQLAVPNLPAPYYSTTVSTTAVYATTRVVLSFDRVVTPNITLGGRIGMGFGGSPEFRGYHVEARGAYWLVPLDKPGIEPYVGLAGGMAQVDAGVDAFRIEALPEGSPPDTPAPEPVPYHAYKLMGQAFVALSGGAVLPIGTSLGLQANVNMMVLFPSSGFVIEPSLGGIVGF
ncbi:MAG: hypothetical protein JW940_00795 [Polyangiaceae bacterium]|nr:hypothetical protein [Polyangiaceae bacterium]